MSRLVSTRQMCLQWRRLQQKGGWPAHREGGGQEAQRSKAQAAAVQTAPHMRGAPPHLNR